MSCFCNTSCHLNNVVYRYKSYITVPHDDISCYHNNKYYGGCLKNGIIEERNKDRIKILLDNERIVIDLKTRDVRTFETIGDVPHESCEPEYILTKYITNDTKYYNRKRLISSANGGYSIQNWAASETTPIISYENTYIGNKKVIYYKQEKLRKINCLSYIAYINPIICDVCKCDTCYLQLMKGKNKVSGEKCLRCNHPHQDYMYCSYIEGKNRCRCLINLKQTDIDTEFPPFTIFDNIFYFLTCQLKDREHERDNKITSYINQYDI